MTEATASKAALAVALAGIALYGVIASAQTDEQQKREEERNRSAPANATTHRGTESQGAHRSPPAYPGAPPPGARSPGVPTRTLSPSGGGPLRPAPSPPRSFAARPVPLGGAELHTAGGAVIRTRANGARSDLYDPARGIAIHHGLDGGRRIEVERPDHSRIVVESGARGYVQHPYLYRGQEFAQRTYIDHGRVYQRFYRSFRYHGLVLERYVPARFYPVGFYAWAYRPWGAPVRYGWSWARAPWYGYYGYYFAPYPVYAGAAYWLTDYLIATSLQAAYDAQATVPPPTGAAAGSAPALSPEVKAMIADEVQRDMQQEEAQARANSATAADAPSPPPPASTGIVQRLSDNAPHVFMAGAPIDLVDEAGKECTIGPGDVLIVSMAPAPAATTADATILSSKGAMECPASAMVMISLADLQDMQNHIRETLDEGMASLQMQQGQGGLPAAPPSAAGEPMPAAFAAMAPPPDALAATEIAEQSQAADQTELLSTDVVPAAGAAGAGGRGASIPSTISLGQTIDAVTAVMGTPVQIVDLGAKKIYVYPALKITFQDGKVSDVQ